MGYRIDSAQLEPPPEEPRRPVDFMCDCIHQAACWRMAEMAGLRVWYHGGETWGESRAAAMECANCTEWDDG